jgi:hypothetical protein
MTDPRLDTVPKGISRAERFPLNIPVRYREPNRPEWLEGRTENISCSGVLLHTDASVPPKITVELRFELPISVLGEAPGEVVCKGTVVRTQEDPLSGIPTALAIAIRSYRMTRGGQQVH